jgi:hypothetical protein
MRSSHDPAAAGRSESPLSLHYHTAAAQAAGCPGATGHPTGDRDKNHSKNYLNGRSDYNTIPSSDKPDTLE